MKIAKNVLILLLAIMFVILIFLLVKKPKNNNNTSQNDKIISEINFLDSKFVFLLNEANNTSLGILNNESNIDWNEIKKEIEMLYSVIPSLTLDLYNMNINPDEILSLNKDFDELIISVKNEDKEKTLSKLANLYMYLPIFAKQLSEDFEYISLLETKSNIFKSYVFIDKNNWNEASAYIKNAIESYSRVLNNLERNNYKTNKIYIILNEIQNAINIKDKDVFLIKYKSFIDETKK